MLFLRLFLFLFFLLLLLLLFFSGDPLALDDGVDFLLVQAGLEQLFPHLILVLDFARFGFGLLAQLALGLLSLVPFDDVAGFFVPTLLLLEGFLFLLESLVFNY